jgi:hypothetical protein
MPNWAEILRPDQLGLSDPTVVQDLQVVERTDLDGDRLVEVRVALAPRIGIDGMTGELLSEIRHAIAGQIVAQPGAGYPYVRFFTIEDWEADLRGDVDDDELEDAAA